MKFPIAVLASIFIAVDAAPFQASHQQVPLTPGQDRRLIELAPYQQQWMTEQEVDQLIRNGVHFMDITDNKELGVPSVDLLSSKLPDLPTDTRMSETVYPMLQEIDTTRMREFLTKFSAFHNRYYKSATGTQSAQFLFDTISEIAQNSGRNITVTKFGHSWPQFSIIARFNVDGPMNEEAMVIVGAHQDSINQMNRDGRAPGADDDGSGTTSALEAFRVLAGNPRFRPKRPVEFHWYSAEELGLLGSQAVAAEYKKQGKKVLAMLQNDMTGYVPPKYRLPGQKPTFGIVMDFVDPTLTGFLKTLVKKYADIDYRETKCGYACSDHASWLKAGYRSAFPFEGLFTEHSPYVHTPKDDIESVDVDHMKEFTKLDISFATELSRE